MTYVLQFQKINLLMSFIKIGEVTKSKEIKLISNKGYDVKITGYEHF